MAKKATRSSSRSTATKTTRTVRKKTAKKSASAKKKTAGKKVTTKKAVTKKKVAAKAPTVKKKTAVKKKAAAKKTVVAKKASPARKAASSAVANSAVPSNGDSYESTKLPTEAQLRRVKSGLTRKDMNYFRNLLLEKRTEILGDVAALESDALNGSGDHFSPEHMADVGSEAYEQEFTLGLVESERKMLRQIDEALIRMSKKTYGVCLESAKPISRPRLEAKPWAKYCIEVAREKEKHGDWE